MPAASYDLDDVYLHLSGAATGDMPVVSIMAADNGTDPGSLIQTLTPPVLSDTPAEYIFTPSSPMSLQAGQMYWLMVDAASNTSFSKNAVWSANNPLTLPTGLATMGAYRFSSDDGASYSTSAGSNLFAINGTEVVPEPESYLLMLIGLGAVALVVYRQRRMTGSRQAG